MAHNQDINLCNVKTEDLRSLLAANLMDVQNGALSSSAGEDKIPPYTNNRTILIGLGGTGLKTLNHVKRVLMQKMQPSWTKYIAFLAIDSDNNEFENAAYLTREEFVCTTRDGITEAVNKSSYPKAWLPFVEPEKARELEAYSGNGAGRKRLMGKMKIRYAKSGDNGVDEDIVTKLSAIKADVLDSISEGEHYEVYVIGSLSGGTCSGSFLEIPALVRKALNVAVDKVNINAMLYLPDTVIALDEANKTELMANGYASLKELNYFQGLYMRENTHEEFPYNGEKVKLNHNQGLYNMPYLIGTVAGPMKTSDKVARDTIAEFFISILGNMIPDTDDAEEGVFLVDSFMNNAMNRLGTRPIDDTYDPREVELDGSAHEFPKRYGTIGFAQAAAPQRIIHSYTIGKACVAAGLRPVSDETRKNMAADGEKFLPFLGEYQLETPQVVNQQRMELLKGLMQFMGTYQAQTFKYEAANGSAPDYKDVIDGTAEANIAGARKNAYARATSMEAKTAMENKVKEQFGVFRNVVKSFVAKNGPMAFYNLYNGYAHQIQGQQPAKGIKEWLQLMVDNQDPKSGNPNTWPTGRTFAQQAQAVKNDLNKLGDGLFGKAGEVFSGKRKELAGQWVQKFDLMVNAEINEKRREYMLGRNGILDTYFAQPAQRLAEQLYVFGKILELMTDGYNDSGSKLNDYQSFASVGDNATEVNIAALDPKAHAWVQKQAQECANNVDRAKVRTALVESFFEDPNAWLNVSGDLVKASGENYKLVSEEIPVNARHMFDRVLKENVKLGQAVTVTVLFKNINVDPADYARKIVKELFKKSRPLFNGNLDGKDMRCYVMYPRTLKTDSPEVVEAIEKEAKQLNSAVGFYGTDFADSIMMYQMVAPFEVYHLKDLPAWEYEYEKRHEKLGNGMHGMSPDVKQGKNANGAIVYTEKTSWYDYPAIVYRKDPKAKDSDGNICHEGKIRLKMDETIAKARELGLLFCKKMGDKQYLVHAICMDGSIDWTLDDVTMLPKKGQLYPEGLDLLKAMAEDNRSSLNDLTRPVKLAQAGLMSMNHVSEKWAWEYAYRVLYANRSLFNMIRDTIEKVQPWNELAVAENDKLRAKLKPAKMIRVMQAKMYYEAPDQRWLLEDENGRPAAVFAMTKQALDLLKLKDPKTLKLINNGFTLYYAYTKLMAECEKGKADLDAAVKAAQVKMDDEDTLMELLDHAGKINDMLDEQTTKLRSLGAKLDEEEELEDQKKLIANMADLGITDAKKIVDMCRFYYFAQFWGDV